ncbi:cell surface glycoprotein MUC18-like isoform X2 [Scyliorhinus canicula]|uniref:cell surface glycoprotein MUC18-like isoform X2 n=1 Tax=Scyliorhinus canicula TaxID=7830 RepID=UPI0018F757B1|nr:cell surface glycoprotein MUC18-like isoform X2 [Scyliorhinus canicula]
MSSAAAPGSGASVSGRLCFTLSAFILTITGINGTVQVSTLPVVEAEIGKPINITCVPEISTPSTMKYIQWFVMEKNSRNRIYFQDGESRIVDNETDYTGRINVDEKYTLTIDHVKLGDERTFLCQVGAGPAGSDEAKTELKVYDAPGVPEITPNDATISIMEKGPSKIATCLTRNGYPAPNITWYKDRTPLQPTIKINNKMYMIPQATQEPSGLYTIASTLYYAPEKKDKDSKFYCEVSYRMPPGVDKMKESNRISVPISYPTENVEILFQPSVLKETDNMKLECRSDGSSTVDYTFYRVLDGKTEENFDSADNTFEFKQLQRMDSGVYGCRVLDFDVPDKDFDTNRTIIINYLDPIALKPQGPYIFKAGDKNKTIHCNAEGSQQTTVIWKKHKKTISPENELQLPVVTFDDSGTYTCEVTAQNIPSLYQQKTISIIVKGPPEINCMEKKFHKNGHYVNLTCIFKGNPAPKVACSSGKKALTVRNHQQNNYTVVVSELILPLVTEVLKVTCNGTNKHGSKTHNFTVERGAVAVSTKTPPTGKSHDRSSNGMLIIIVVVCIIVLAFLGAVLYFLYKKGKIPCGRSGKQSITRSGAHDDIVVEVKNDQKVPEETVLLQGVNGEKKPPSDQ